MVTSSAFSSNVLLSQQKNALTAFCVDEAQEKPVNGHRYLGGFFAGKLLYCKPDIWLYGTGRCHALPRTYKNSPGKTSNSSRKPLLPRL